MDDRLQRDIDQVFPAIPYRERYVGPLSIEGKREIMQRMIAKSHRRGCEGHWSYSVPDHSNMLCVYRRFCAAHPIEVAIAA